MVISINNLYEARHEISNLADKHRVFYSTEYLKALRESADNESAFIQIFLEYDDFLKETDFRIVELDSLNRQNLAGFYEWLLDYCNRAPDRSGVTPIVKLHSRTAKGDKIEDLEWLEAADWARNRAQYADRLLSRSASRAALYSTSTTEVVDALLDCIKTCAIVIRYACGTNLRGNEEFFVEKLYKFLTTGII
jgi:hypothetical protein